MSGKNKTVFMCSECGYESSKWNGKCPACNGWNTFEEITLKQTVKSGARKPVSVAEKIEELSEIKTAVSEAVTNSIVHGYENELGMITVSAQIKGDVVTIQVKDKGRGILDIDKAKEPLYTTKPDLERSGMGFTIMENFMDKLTVKSSPSKGTTVTMSKRIKKSIVNSIHKEKVLVN